MLLAPELARPADSANASTGTSPAADTRFGSSNTADVARACERVALDEMPLCSAIRNLKEVRISQPARASARYGTLNPAQLIGGSGLKYSRSRHSTSKPTCPSSKSFTVSVTAMTAA